MIKLSFKMLTLTILMVGVWSGLFARNTQWLWAKQTGGIGTANGHRIALDSSGNIIMAGNFKGTVTFGGTSHIAEYGQFHGFVAKLDSFGEWQWVGRTTGNEASSGSITGLVVDNQDNIYVSGSFRSRISFGNTTLISGSMISSMPFVAKMSSSGNWLWAKQGNTGSSISSGSVNDLAVDEYGNVFITGAFSQGIQFGHTTLTGLGLFVAMLNSYGDWVWAKKADNARGIGIVADDYSQLYLTGSLYDTASFGNRQLTAEGEYDVFIAKMTNTGNWLWAIRAGESGTNTGQRIVLDDFGDVYITGEYQRSISFGNSQLSGGRRFAAKADSDGVWLWCKAIGNGNVAAIHIDGNSNLHLTGNFWNEINIGDYHLTSPGENGIFWAVASRFGDWIWAESAGGAGIETPGSIVTDNELNVYIGGFFTGTSNFGDITLQANGTDSFLTKLSSPMSVEEDTATASDIYVANYPNPFNPETTITFDLPRDVGNLTMKIYNVCGQHIKTLIDGLPRLRGGSSIVWDGKDSDGNEVGTGVYLYRLTADDFDKTTKMLLVR